MPTLAVNGISNEERAKLHIRWHAECKETSKREDMNMDQMAEPQNSLKHIVVVDDEPDIVDFLCTLLRANGYSAVGAHDATEAVQRMQERGPDLLLIDYMMPETDGMTTLQRCRAESGGKQVRAVMLTSDSRLVTLERALTLGFDEFLPKPILDQEEFVQRINDVMTRRS
jgi:CheY-like chemotaxis protein